MSGKEKKVVCTFQPDLPLCSLLMIPFFNNSSNYNKALGYLLPFEFAADKIPHLKHLEMEFYLKTCIFEVGNHLGEHLDGCFSNSSVKILFCLWEIWIEENILFPLSYNDTLHLGTFFYQSMFYSSIHQTLSWFCLIIPQAWKSNCDISFLLFPVLFLKKESARKRERNVKVQPKQKLSD